MEKCPLFENRTLLTLPGKCDTIPSRVNPLSSDTLEDVPLPWLSETQREVTRTTDETAYLVSIRRLSEMNSRNLLKSKYNQEIRKKKQRKRERTSRTRAIILAEQEYVKSVTSDAIRERQALNSISTKLMLKVMITRDNEQ